MNYQELLDQAELNGFVKIPMPPKYERVTLYSISAYTAAFPDDVFYDDCKFILVGEECDEEINTADDLKAALPPMGV